FRNKNPGHDPVRQSLPRVPRCNIDMVFTRASADESSVVDGMENLTGPPIAYTIEFGEPLSCPSFKLLIPCSSIVGLAGSMVFSTSDEQIILCFGLESNIVIGISRFPIKRVLNA